MEEDKISEILGQVAQSKPFACGNSRKCYNIYGFAVLQEKSDEKVSLLH